MLIPFFKRLLLLKIIFKVENISLELQVNTETRLPLYPDFQGL